MAHDNRKLDRLESALNDLAEAEAAGVFRRTTTDQKWLTSPGRVPAAEPQPFWSHMTRRMRWVGVAAAVVMAVGVWSWMFRAQLGEIRDGPHRTGLMTDTVPPDSARFLRCLSGPQGPDRAICQSSDLDADGDVDLADLRVYQVAYASKR